MATISQIFNEHAPRYWQASRQEKGELLTHVCAITQMHRKAAIRKFNVLQMSDASTPERRGRSTHYTPDVTAALKELWTDGNEVCGELLHPMIKDYVTILQRDGLWHHGDETTIKVLAISQATVKRRVGTFLKARRTRKGLSDTKPAHLKYLVPIFTGPWGDYPPGYGQLDTVRHSNSASGDAVYTCQYTDAATLGVFPRAQWNKGQLATQRSMQHIKDTMPFPWLGGHPDTGSEFMNTIVIDWCQAQGVELSRSRPNHKNDNMYVEERNGHVIRKTVGYLTLNCVEAVEALNAVYDLLTPYLFHFVAVRRMIMKERVGARYRRTYEKTAATPYQRTLAHSNVSREIKEKLRQAHTGLNPRTLHAEIDRRLMTLYAVQQRFGNPKPLGNPR